MFEKILVANRGEIALRVMRTCKEMGITTVAIYSDVDKNALHTRYADEAYHVGPSPSLQSYLNADKIIEISKESGAEAIHPGYGFLAENPEFAFKCVENKITFIGPDSWAMAKAGDKIASRKFVKQSGIPVTPGSDEAVGDNDALDIANEIGFPIILKSSAGGGGISMGVVENKKDLLKQLEIARSSSLSAFGNPNIFIEKFLIKPRHIEFQILADKHGNIVHLGERECSIQRRFQKLIEEAPSPVFDENKRKEIGERAVEIARLAEYTNAGTIEFLYDGKEFYFNEVNARLQVEHPVTEMITAKDLVKDQIKIAAGDELDYSQEDIQFKGWAMECRINAEDPYNNFLPSPGTITRYEPPGSIGTRIDSGLVVGSEIPTFYDSLFAKVIVWGDTRETVVERMMRALREMRVEGIETNIPFHLKVLSDNSFKKGDIDTTFISRKGIIDNLKKEGEEQKIEMERTVAVISAALAQSKDGLNNYLKIDKKTDIFKPVSKWKMAGRYNQINRRQLR
ncbi:MAG: acetyl-CoA carboxylase biotin carboxylase subunit [Thermoplasmatales archaeon]|nr:MAG: acetyl-CoA carboxylase biotin carboxylase subunit [Thermoplasmatales archaeon]